MSAQLLLNAWFARPMGAHGRMTIQSARLANIARPGFAKPAKPALPKPAPAWVITSAGIGPTAAAKQLIAARALQTKLARRANAFPIVRAAQQKNAMAVISTGLIPAMPKKNWRKTAVLTKPPTIINVQLLGSSEKL